jgi:DNA-binding GntR family transcriptional regulator
MKVQECGVSKKKKANDKDVYLEIFEAILSFRLKPGTKLTEDNLSKIFGVGRTTIRSALLRLAHDHIVQIEPHKGAYIASPSVKQAKDILSARKLIEVAIVEDVIKNATTEDYILLKEIVTSEQDQIGHEKIIKGIRLSGDFHLLLAKMSGNVTLERIATTLVPQTSLIIVLYERPDQPKCSHIEHFELIDVMQNGDVAKASSLMAKHIQGIEDRLKLDEREVVSDLEDIFRKR